MLTLEMCERLKEAGFRQDMELAWFNTILGFPRNTEYVSYIQKMNIGMPSVCACPTADEIWAELTVEQMTKFFASRTKVRFCDYSVGYEWEIIVPYSIETALAEYWLEVNG